MYFSTTVGGSCDFDAFDSDQHGLVEANRLTFSRFHRVIPGFMCQELSVDSVALESTSQGCNGCMDAWIAR